MPRADRRFAVIEYRDTLISLLLRALVAAPFFVAGYILYRGGGDSVAEMGRALLGCACVVVGAMIVAFPLARLLAEPAGDFFYPVRRFSRP